MCVCVYICIVQGRLYDILLFVILFKGVLSSHPGT